MRAKLWVVIACLAAGPCACSAADDPPGKSAGETAAAALPLPERGSAPRSGNLVSGDGALLVVTESTIEAHYSYEDLRDRLLKRMAEHADDP